MINIINYWIISIIYCLCLSIFIISNQEKETIIYYFDIIIIIEIYMVVKKKKNKKLRNQQFNMKQKKNVLHKINNLQR